MPITALLPDIGSALLANGWGYHARESTAKTLDMDLAENAANQDVISAAAGRVTVRVIHPDEERKIARPFCRGRDPGCKKEK
jgi:hypothetical protein